jgi:hypothetical protein
MNRSCPLKPRTRTLRQLDRLIADLNIVLAMVALCLVVLDATVFATLFLSDEILDRQDIGMTSAAYRAPNATFGRFTESW